MAIKIGDTTLESASGSATFNGTNLTRINYYGKTVWDKGVSLTPVNDLRLFLVECGKCGNPNYGYATVRIANAIGQDITPSIVCFSNVVNNYDFEVYTSGGVCGHIKIDDDWYTFDEQFSSISIQISMNQAEIVPVNCCSFSVQLYKSSNTFDSDELGFVSCYMNIDNQTTSMYYYKPWVVGQTYCV